MTQYIHPEGESKTIKMEYIPRTARRRGRVREEGEYSLETRVKPRKESTSRRGEDSLRTRVQLVEEGTYCRASGK